MITCKIRLSLIERSALSVTIIKTLFGVTLGTSGCTFRMLSQYCVLSVISAHSVFVRIWLGFFSVQRHILLCRVSKKKTKMERFPTSIDFTSSLPFFLSLLLVFFFFFRRRRVDEIMNGVVGGHVVCVVGHRGGVPRPRGPRVAGLAQQLFRNGSPAR